MDEKDFKWPFDIQKLKRIVNQGRIETMVKPFYDGEITDFDWGVAFDIIFTVFGNDAFETTNLSEIENSIALSFVTRKREDLRGKSPLEIIDMVIFNNQMNRMDPEFLEDAKKVEQRVKTELDNLFKVNTKESKEDPQQEKTKNSNNSI